MHAEAEIKFECSRCGQHLSIAANGAGQAINCPTCREQLVVPQADGMAGANGMMAHGEVAGRHCRTSDGQESDSSALREQLVDAARTQVRMEKDLAAARLEIVSLQEQSRRMAQESERLAASLTQLQSENRELAVSRAELLVHQNEMQQHLSAEHVELEGRTQIVADLQRALTKSQEECVAFRAAVEQLETENRELAASRAELLVKQNEMQHYLSAEHVELEGRSQAVADLQRALAKSQEECVGFSVAVEHLQTENQELAASRTQLLQRQESVLQQESAWQAAFAEKERLISELQRACERSNTECEALRSSLTQTQAENREFRESQRVLHRQQEKLRQRDAAQRSELATRAEKLAELQRAYEKSDAERGDLARETEALRNESVRLRERAELVESLERELVNLTKDLETSTNALECNRLRARTEAAVEKQNSLQKELESVRAEMEQLAKIGWVLRRELDETKDRCRTAELRAEELSEAKAHADNEVLRAILGRQKAELENCYRDLKHFRRAQLGLRLTYALFALGLLGVAVFAIQVLPGITNVF